MEKVLPKLTPSEIREWVSSIENFHSISALYDLPFDATLKQIEDAFNSDRSVLIGIGEEIMSRAKWDAWSSFVHRIKYEE